MEFNQLVALLGQSPSVDPLNAHLVQNGVTRQPVPPADEGMAFVKLHELGYEMRFDLMDDGVSVFLSALTAYPKGNGEYKPFTGSLPAGIMATEHRGDLLARLGPPQTHNDWLYFDAWTVDGRNLCVTYDEDDDTLIEVQVNLN